MTHMRAIVYNRHGQPVWAAQDPQQRPLITRPQLLRTSSRSWKFWKSSDQQQQRQQRLLIRVTAVGINPVDAKGVIGDKIPLSWTRTQALAKRFGITNRVIGFDFAGVVVDVEPKSKSASTSFKVGDAVCGIVPPSRYDGTLAEYIAVSSQQVTRIFPTPTQQKEPDSASTSMMQQYAALPLVGITCLQCLQGAGWGTTEDSASTRLSKTRSPPMMNENTTSHEHIPTLLVLGASGGTGHMAIQIGRAMMQKHNSIKNNTAPASYKIVAVCSERNRQLVQELLDNGKTAHQSTQSANNPNQHHVVLDYRSDDFVQALEREGPYSVIMDCVSSGDPRDQTGMNYEQLLLSPESRHRFLYPHAEYRRLGGGLSDWFKAGIERLTGISLWKDPRAKLFWIQMHDTAPLLKQLADWMREGVIQGPYVSEAFGFSPQGVQKAFDALDSRRVVGKVVVALPDDKKEESSGS